MNHKLLSKPCPFVSRKIFFLNWTKGVQSRANCFAIQRSHALLSWTLCTEKTCYTRENVKVSETIHIAGKRKTEPFMIFVLVPKTFATVGGILHQLLCLQALLALLCCFANAQTDRVFKYRSYSSSSSHLANGGFYRWGYMQIHLRNLMRTTYGKYLYSTIDIYRL